MKNMKKLVSLMLTLIMVAGCMAIPMTASAAITPGTTIDFSYLTTGDAVSAIQTNQSGWGLDIFNETRGVCSYEGVDRGDDNGFALKWNATAGVAGNHWQTGFWRTNTVTLNGSVPLDLSNASGKQAWISFDFAMEGADLKREIVLFNGWALDKPIYVMSKPTGAVTASYNGTSTSDVIVDNGWHTIDVCQEITGSASTKIVVYLDGKSVSEMTYDAVQSFQRFYMYMGGASAAGNKGSFSFDNIKSFTCDSGDYTPVVPVVPETPAEYEVVKTISSAAEWAAAVPAAYIPAAKFVDVPGSSGKATTDTAVRIAYAEGEPVIGTYNSTVQVRTPLSVALTPDEKRDVIISFDLKHGEANYNKRIYFKRSNYAYHNGFEFPYNNYYDVIPVNSWNHYDIRFTETSEELYVNGILKSTTNVGGTITEINPIWNERSYVQAPSLGISEEIDNFKIAYCPVEDSVDTITAPQKIFRNYDFTGVLNNAGNYMIPNGTTGNTYVSADMTFSGAAADAIRDGFAGKPASDKVMKFYSDANTWKEVAFRTATDTSNPNVAVPKTTTSAIWGSREFEPGSVVRGGVSILLDEDSFTGTETTKRITVRPYAAGSLSVYTEIDLQFTAQDVRIKHNMTEVADDNTIVAPKAALNQWHRVDYVLNVADGKGRTNTVDFYLNGVLMNDEPIEVNFDYPADNGTAATTSVGNVTLTVMCNGTAPCYLDDFTYEYIPSGLEVELDALAKTVALPGSADGSVVLGSGAIVLMDAATSAVTADGLNAKLCPNTPVSLVDASGAAVTSGPAAGNYAYLSRGVLPGIFYKVSDLDVAIDGKEVTATLPYAVDEDVIMIVALYKGADQFATCLSDTAEDGQLSVTVSDDEATSYKVFLWKSEAWMMPFYAAAEGALN